MITDSLTLSAIGVVFFVLVILGIVLLQENCPCKGPDCKGKKK